MRYVLVLATSAIVAFVAAALVRRNALRRGVVVEPRADRWHRTATPTFGGIAVVFGVTAGLLLETRSLVPAIPVLAAGTALFVVGWYDDVRPLSALAKMVSTLSVASFFVFALSAAMTKMMGSAIWSTPLTGVSDAGLALLSPAVSLVAIVWFGGLDNAINLLDNMDGLAAGVTAIAAIGLAVSFASELGVALTGLLVALAGSMVGFLFWNRHPARLFMGNCGSLAVGGLLAGCSTIAVLKTRSVAAVIAAGLILIVPLFDTSFVLLLRRLAGRSATRGNIDHASHRLVSMGFSDLQATLVLYGIGGAGAVTGFLIQRHGLSAWPTGAVVSLAVVILGFYLARVPVYAGEDFRALRAAPLAPLLSDLTFRWHAGEVLLDLVLIATCYDTAYRIRFDGADLPVFLSTFGVSLPVIVGCKIASLYASGLYSRAWSTFGFHDLMTVLRGVALGSTLSILAAIWISKFEGFSRGVFLIDAVLLTAAIVATRLSFRVLSRIGTATGARRRVLIVGCGARGQLLVRELRDNPSWGLEAVAFLDEGAVRGRRILGVPVRGAVKDLHRLVPTLQIDEVLLSMPDLSADLEARIRETCGVLNVVVRRLHLDLQ